MNKKGFIRILEAIFAIMLIMGAVLIIISNNLQTADISEEAYEKQRYILEIISNNEGMRNEIIDYDKDSTPPKPLPKTNEFIISLPRFFVSGYRSVPGLIGVSSGIL